MEKHNFVTIEDLSKEKILYLLEMAKEFENHPNRELLKGKVVATLFFEPSTRTNLVFKPLPIALEPALLVFLTPRLQVQQRAKLLKTPFLWYPTMPT